MKKSKKKKHRNGKVVPFKAKPQLVAAEEAAPQTRVFIAVPCMDSAIGVNVHNMIVAAAMANANPDSGFYFEWDQSNGRKPVEYARNLLTRRFLETTCEWLYFVDTDMLPPENPFDLIRSATLGDFDIVVGQALSFRHKTARESEGMKLCAFIYNDHEKGFRPVQPGPRERIKPCDAAGTGCMVIHRRVLEDPRLHLDPDYVGLDGALHSLNDDDYKSTADWAPALFRTIRRPNGHALRGEDIDFTWRATQLGYRLAIDLGVRFGHLKRIDIDQALGIVDRAVRMTAGIKEKA
jgi:hypothetical protein